MFFKPASTRYVFLLLLAMALLATAATSAHAGSYYLTDDWGGAWADADKTVANTEDDLLCWAAAASNVLEWTGWGHVETMSDTDDMFEHFQDHFTDAPGNPYYAWDWWFDGTNDPQGWSGWAQEDVDGGGGFFPTENINDYRRFSSNDAAAMKTIDTWLHDGYGTSIWIGGPGAHLITVWGFSIDDASGTYTGLYVTDSDDYTNQLKWYGVQESGDTWYLQGYGGSNSWYVGEVIALGQRPETVPEPASMLLVAVGLGALGLQRRRRERRD